MMKMRTEAEDKAGMTLEELGRFVDYTRMVGVPPESIIQVEIGWRSQLKAIQVK